MRRLVMAVAVTAGVAMIAPVTGLSAAKADSTMKLTQVGVEIGTDRDRDWRDHRREEWREHQRRGCRDVTIRERRGDEVVVRHVHRCD